MSDIIRAKDVAVRHYQRAECQFAECAWTGDLRDDYQAANADRLGHLEDHRKALEATPHG